MSGQFSLARKEKLVIRELADEVLVYDLARNKALALNRVAGAVWKLSDGTKSPSQIADALSEQFGANIEETAVWAAIEQLGRDHLLEYCIPTPTAGETRRDHLKKAAAIAGPMVLALAVPTARADNTGTCISGSAPCTPGGIPCCGKKKCVVQKGSNRGECKG